MMHNGMTRRDAARKWVYGFNAIPSGMVKALMIADPDSWREVTEPGIGDSVYVYDLPEDCDSLEHSGKINSILEDGDYAVSLEDGPEIVIDRENFEVEYETMLPMWSTLWMFGESIDDWWLENCNGVQAMSECGFRIYEHDEFGYVFGIDGAGYDFLDAHWIPLYNKRGLHWHDPDTDEEDAK